MKGYVVYLVVMFFMFSMCNTVDISKKLTNLDSSTNKKNLTKEEVIQGLKEALEIGTKKAVSIVSKVGGFWNDSIIKIPIPEKLEKVTDKLSELGFKKDVEKLHKQLNIAAEKSSAKALNIFYEQIKKISFDDAIEVLTGSDSSITLYFKIHTSVKLYNAFKPQVHSTLNELNIINYYGKLINVYNKLPFVKKVEFNLTDYVTNKTLDGLFIKLKEQELNIRNNPIFRETNLLKKVFDKNNWHWTK